MVLHNIDPVYDENSRMLILGSFPSVKSRETGFFYGHPQNRFWKVLAAVFGERTPATVPEKKAMLLRNNVAVWDVIKSCEITGSSDISVKNAVPNDVAAIVKNTKITRVYTNGALASRLYEKTLEKRVGIKATPLPSTSPANAAWSLPRLTAFWSAALREK